MELFVFVILFTVAGAQENQLKGPENTLSVVGSNVTLKCASPSRNCIGIVWSKKEGSSNPITVFRDDRGILGAYKARYSVDNSSGCDLIIRNIALGDAGRFICQAEISSGSDEKTAYLIILQTQPKCTTNASLNNTVEGERVQLNCSVSFNGTNRASMVWEGVTNAPTAEVQGRTISRSFIIDAAVPEVPSFTCITSFPVETKDNYGALIQGLAANDARITCNTSAIEILYSVRNVTLSPSRFNYSAGSVISCSAKGHPSPTYKWQELKNNSTWVDIPNESGSEFTTVSNVDSKRRLRCLAMNIVRGKSYNDTSDEFLVYDKHGDENDSLLDTSTTPIPLAVMAASASGGFLILIILLVIVCFGVRDCQGYKRCHSGQKPKDNKRKSHSLTDDPEIYCVIDEVPDFAPIAKKPKLAPTIKPPKLPTKDKPLPEVPRCASKKAKPRSAPTIKPKKQLGSPATVKPLPELPQCASKSKPISVPTIKPPKPQGPPTKAKPRPEVPPKASKAKQPKLATPFRLPKLHGPPATKAKPAPPAPKTKPSPDVPSSTSKAKPIPAPTSQPLKLPVPPKPVKPSPNVERSAPKVKPISIPTNNLLKLPVLPMLAKPSPDVPSSAPKAKPIPAPASKPLKPQASPPKAKPCNGNPTAGHTNDYQDVYLPINHVEEEEEEYTCLTTGEDPNVYEVF